MTYDFSTTAQEIIERALRIVGAVPAGSTPSTVELNNARYSLNTLIKKISSEGVRLWTLSEVIYQIPTPSTVIGSDDNYYYAIQNHTGTTLSSPVSGNEYSDYWVNGADTTSTVHAVSASYTTSHILSLSASFYGIDRAFYRENSVDYKLNVITYQDYFSLEDKFVRTTIPTHIALQDNKIFIYPYPYTATGRVHILGIRYIGDIDGNSDVPDFPVEWYDALTYLLAERLSDEYSKELNERIYLSRKAEDLYRKAMNSDRSNTNTMTVSSAYRNWR